MAALARPRASFLARGVVLLVVVLAFAAGYKLSAYWQSKNRVQASSGVPPTDFAIPLPEGQTRITITDPQLENPRLVSFLVERHANSYTGIPQKERVIEPRIHLSGDDLAFFRQELAGLLPEMGGWVYQDPTFNCYWTIDGRPASALQLHHALMSGKAIKPVSGGGKAQAPMDKYYVDPRLLFRHISYEYKPGGPLLYYVDGRLEPLNMRDRNWIQSD